MYHLIAGEINLHKHQEEALKELIEQMTNDLIWKLDNFLAKYAAFDNYLRLNGID